jgi:hypothetical protein
MKRIKAYNGCQNRSGSSIVRPRQIYASQKSTQNSYVTVPLSGQIFTNSKEHKTIIPPSPGALDRYPAAVTAHLTMTSACKAGKFFYRPYLIITFIMPLLLILPESGYQMGPGVSRRPSTRTAHSDQQVPQL